MSFLERIRECKNYNSDHYIPFFFKNIQLGQIHVDFAKNLNGLSNDLKTTPNSVSFAPKSTTLKGRTHALSKIVNKLHANGFIKGWRNELYPISTSFYNPPIIEIERAAAPLFGVKSFGVHLNGYVKKKNRTYLWVGKRSIKKATGAGKFDQLVAGGQPAGITVKNNLLKECMEEASISNKLVKT